MKPMIQIALDQTKGNNAFAVLSHLYRNIDIIEVGTILSFAEGIQVTKDLRKYYPNHLLVCDMKITDGGTILSQMAFESGANWVTVSAAAHIATIEACKAIADKFDGEIQMELYGNWTIEEAKKWITLGIKQVIYHRSRDAELAGTRWTASDLNKMCLLSRLGFELSITGGIVPEDIYLFKHVNVKAFIVGRALTGDKGKETVEALNAQIERYWR
ncbi:3-dehydro-L-gulonate-6-phosphate decarboxylase (plasmid) [Vibrio scophthalmi]|nr:3-dehydro-L-gulonate-6-phosphate decarboxylase [Vibrio scophthalmi]ANS88271.1 3-dehydro-L-gulonate-6-phosphate decarboxylase [Vibrio scophthalmi]